MATLKGQNVRICIYDTTASKYKVIGMSTGCTITLTNNVDDSSHKDIVGMAAMPVVTSKSWQVSVDSLDVADTAAMLSAIKSMQPVTLMWDETSTSNNQTREKAAFARKGSAYMNDVTFNFNDRENSTKALQFAGSGALETVGSFEKRGNRACSKRIPRSGACGHKPDGVRTRLRALHCRRRGMCVRGRRYLPCAVGFD